MEIVITALYPTRIQLSLDELTGPFTSTALGAFSPQRDLEVYVDGAPVTIISSYFDLNGGSPRYLLYTGQPFNIQGVVQVIYHMPVDPFVSSTGEIVPGFALIAGIVTTPITDVQPTPTLGILPVGASSYAELSVLALPQNLTSPPTYSVAGVEIGTPGPGTDNTTLAWYAQSIPNIRIQIASVYDSGIISSAAVYGTVHVPGLTSGDTYTVTIAAYDATDTPIVVSANPFVLTVVIDMAS